jgi:TatD DNase family protein
MLIDSHAHLNFQAFKEDLDRVIERCRENNLWVVNIGSQYNTSKRAVEIAENQDQGFFAAIGLHPIHLETGLVKIKEDKEEIELKTREEKFDCQKYKELAGSSKVVAIGEIGLDYYRKPKNKGKRAVFKERQIEALSRQLELAKELKLPVVLHCRMAHPDLIAFLNERKDLRPEKAVAHSFVGTVEELKNYLNFGYYIGINGIIFKNIPGIDFEEIIKIAPRDKILLETDCPYLAPPPHEGKRNEPSFIKYVAEKVAEIKKESFEKIAEKTSENARIFFGI